MRKKPLALIASAALVVTTTFLSAPTLAIADEPVATPTALASVPHDQKRPQGDDQGRPRHRIDESREGGFEGVQLVLVGAAIVVALGLAYRAGRRRRDA